MTAIYKIENIQGLGSDEIREAIPTVYTPEAHPKQSQRYLYIPTGEIIEGLRSKGFVPTMVGQSRSRNADNQAYTKHMVWLRAIDSFGRLLDEVPQVVLINSHNGTSLYKLFIGIYRFVCSNGLMDGRTNSSIAIPHRGNILDNVINGTYALARSSQQTLEIVEAMKNTRMTDEARITLAYWAMYARFGELYEDVPYTPEDFLKVTLPGDNLLTLYNLLNVLQYNLLNGKISGQAASGRQHSLRGVGAIDKVVQVNTDLWNYAMEFIK